MKLLKLTKSSDDTGEKLGQNGRPLNVRHDAFNKSMQTLMMA